VADVNARDAKLIQYLNEAYGKERQLETALQAHIEMTTRPPYRKRLQQHLTETKNHARQVERRIKQLGGTAEPVPVPGPEVVAEGAAKVTEVAQKAMALAQGPLHAVRGTGENEKQLKNAKDEFSNEAAEIATYTAIQTLAETVGDRDTAKLARSIRRDEERMASFLERLIPQLSKAVAQSEIPAALRNGASRRNGSRRTTTRSSSRSTSSRSTSSRSRTGSSSRSGSRSTSRSGGRATPRSGSRSTSASGSRSTARSGSRSTASRSSSRSKSSRSTAARSGSGTTRTASGRGSSRTAASRSSARRTTGRSSGRRATAGSGTRK
jgi:ferritin-like metal-binding protein YciE